MEKQRLITLLHILADEINDNVESADVDCPHAAEPESGFLRLIIASRALHQCERRFIQYERPAEATAAPDLQRATQQ